MLVFESIRLTFLSCSPHKEPHQLICAPLMRQTASNQHTHIGYCIPTGVLCPIASSASLATEHRLCAMLQVLWQSGALAFKGQCPQGRQTLSATTPMLEPWATACLCACWCLGHCACCPIQVNISQSCCPACTTLCNLVMLSRLRVKGRAYLYNAKTALKMPFIALGIICPYELSADSCMHACLLPGLFQCCFKPQG